MKTFQWNDSYSVGVSEIDAQHQQLFDLLNQLYNTTQESHVDTVLQGILSQLKDYTQFHFKAEETFMQASGYPAHAEHKSKHEEFTAKIITMQESFQKGGVNPGEVLNLAVYLRDWLANHILVTDKQMAPYAPAAAK